MPAAASANAAAWNEPGFATISSSSVVCVFVLLCLFFRDLLVLLFLSFFLIP